MPFQVGAFGSADPRKAAIEKARAKSAAAKPEDAAIVRYIPPAECTDRIRIVFDDSGSMSSQIANAKRGVVEFLKNCIPNQTAVAVHFMNSTAWATTLRSDLPQLGADIEEASLQSGGTPFFNTLKKALEATPRLTRLVAFTDGSPTDELRAEQSSELQDVWGRSNAWKASADVIITISKAQKPEIPIDTVFFGSVSTRVSEEYNQREIELLKYLSEKTGGFFLHFDPAKPNIWKQLKYLAPVNRLRLTDGAFRAKVERGE